MTGNLNNIKILNAFSLTEVLVTMFIIMLLIIASAPMITKKNAKNKAPHGTWECYLDDSGKHVTKKTLNGATVADDGGVGENGDYCIFKPQHNAKNYTVTLIGGGGGGASGTAFSLDRASYGIAATYIIPADGEYDILLIGGGGGGSAYLGNQGAKGGGAGEIRMQSVHLMKGDMASLVAGAAGERGGSGEEDTEGSGSSGGSETEEDSCDGPVGTSWKDICKGKDGGDSRFFVYKGTADYTAKGGKGGTQSQGQNGGSSTAYVNKGADYGVEINFADPSLSKFINSVNYDGVTFGFGGNGNKSELGERGRSGVVMLISKAHHSGGGGKRGYAAFTTLENITDEVKVYVGKGGAGATTEDTNGEQGQNTSFGYYVTAKGGEGGTIRYMSRSDSTGLSGEDGGDSPYGGMLKGGGNSAGNLDAENKMSENDGYKKPSEDMYGAGGGGGGSIPRDAVNQTSDGKWGMGGRGMSGYVRVEWN